MVTLPIKLQLTLLGPISSISFTGFGQFGFVNKFPVVVMVTTHTDNPIVYFSTIHYCVSNKITILTKNTCLPSLTAGYYLL